MQKENMLAVIGAGYWGKNLVRNFFELGVLRGVCDTNLENMRSMTEAYPSLKIFSSLEECLSDKDISGVALATPAECHYSMVKQALLSGKDVFVEKPLSLTVEEGVELERLSVERSRVLMVDHVLRYHPAVIKLKELIDGGVLGKLQYIYSHRLNIGKLRREENILWSFAPHDISVILYLVNEFPKKIRAFGEAYLQDKIYDTTITDLAFHDRLKAHIFVSWLHPFKEQKLVVIGNKNMAVFDDMAEENKLVLYPHRVEWVNRVPVASKACGEVVPVEKNEPLRQSCRHFLDCMRDRAKPKTDGLEALRVLQVLQQAQEDLDRGSHDRA